MVIIKSEPLIANVSPVMFHLYASQYLQCATDFKYAGFSPVPYFLLCRAIELALKAKHLKTRSRRQVKKDYGHNIKKAYDELDLPNKILDSSEYQELEKASEIYNIPKKGFEYCSVYDACRGFSNFPELSILKSIAQKLVTNHAEQRSEQE